MACHPGLVWPVRGLAPYASMDDRRAVKARLNQEMCALKTLQRNPKVILAIIMTSTLMVVMDVSIVTTALPKIHAGLDFTSVGLSWVINAYSLVFGGLMLFGARSGDLLGRRRMFLVGLAIFTFASLAVGLAQSVAELIMARAVQGLGGAILSPSWARPDTRATHGRRSCRGEP